jgi:hypothetical protein
VDLRNRLALLVLGGIFMFAAPAFADSTSSGSFNFASTLGNLGTSDTLTAGSFSVVATGYSSPGMTTDLYEKNEGPNEIGMGIANAPDHEINGTSFIQLNMTQILATSPTSVMLGVGSIQFPDTYQIWGSNTAGALGTMLATNQNAFTYNLSNFGQYNYISVVSPTGTVLIDGLAVNTALPAGATTPEPTSATMLIVGLAALLGARLALKRV